MFKKKFEIHIVMIDKKDFKKIKSSLDRYDAKREELIKKSRDLLKRSKQLIYALHRENKEEVNELLKEVKKARSELDNIASSVKGLLFEHSYSEAIQEYVEAMAYHGYINLKKIPSSKELKVAEEDFLLGISDLTGELTRRAVKVAHKGKKELGEIKGLVEDIFGEFLNFNLRNGNLRKKADSIKWNLKKLEEVMYDVLKK